MRKQKGTFVMIIALSFIITISMTFCTTKQDNTDIADLVIVSDAVFTGLGNEPVPGSVAIKGDRILAVGKKEEIGDFIGEGTKVYKFDDRLVMPGFHDAHLHVMSTGLAEAGVPLRYVDSKEKCVRNTKEFADAHPDLEWIYGFGWHYTHWKEKIPPTKEDLDAVIPDRPVYLVDVDGHTAWVNSKALEICGITKETPNPKGGIIHRYDNGEPTGYLEERASGLVAGRARKSLMIRNAGNNLKVFLDAAARHGITSVNDMSGIGQENFQLYKSFEKEGALTARVHINSSLMGDIKSAIEIRDKCTSGRLYHMGIKGFVDGVGMARSAYMLKPYSDDPASRGYLTGNEENIRQSVIAADKAGFNVHLHACGDAAVRLSLDWFEEAMKLNERENARHSVEHADHLDPADIPRFGELDVIASIQPEIMAPVKSFKDNLYPIRLGPERSVYAWPYKSLQDGGAVLALGTDSAVTEFTAMRNIYRALTRLHDDGTPAGGWNPQECLTLADCLRAYTYNPAYMVGREDELGTLEVGKYADIIVLDRNLFNVPAREILDTEVELTIMDGRIIYKK